MLKKYIPEDSAFLSLGFLVVESWIKILSFGVYEEGEGIEQEILLN